MLLSDKQILPTVEGHSIYIRNLPLNVTVGQLEAEFKKFGPIKPEGIQVRNNKVIIGLRGFSNCLFAFSSTLMQFCWKHFICLYSNRDTVLALLSSYL